MFRQWKTLLLASALCACTFHMPDRGQPQQVVKDRAGNIYTFGDVDQVAGTRFFTVPILRSNGNDDGGAFSSDGRGDDQRNRLIVDSSTGASRRVLPNQNLQIVNWLEPAAEPQNQGELQLSESAKGKVSSGLYAAVVKRPGKTTKDRPTYDVLLGRFDTGQQAWIASGLSGVQSLWITPDHRLAMVAATASGGIYRAYDPATFRRQLEAKLPL
jgi:hypothetical protein